VCSPFARAAEIQIHPEARKTEVTTPDARECPPWPAPRRLRIPVFLLRPCQSEWVVINCFLTRVQYALPSSAALAIHRRIGKFGFRSPGCGTDDDCKEAEEWLSLWRSWTKRHLLPVSANENVLTSSALQIRSQVAPPGRNLVGAKILAPSRRSTASSATVAYITAQSALRRCGVNGPFVALSTGAGRLPTWYARVSQEFPQERALTGI